MEDISLKLNYSSPCDCYGTSFWDFYIDFPHHFLYLYYETFVQMTYNDTIWLHLSGRHQKGPVVSCTFALQISHDANGIMTKTHTGAMKSHSVPMSTMIT